MKPPGEVDLTEDKSVRPHIAEITPELYLGWRQRGFNLKGITDDGINTCLLNIGRFRDLKEGELYMLERPGDSFSGYANTEAIIQTEDACHSIIRGDIHGLEAFKGSDVFFEYNIQPPKDIMSVCKWDFPIKPDALIMKGTQWLFLESKHTLEKKHVNYFAEKILFLQEHIDKKWLFKEHQQRKPDIIIGAMCSISRPDPSIFINKNSICLIRNGFKFIRHVLHC